MLALTTIAGSLSDPSRRLLTQGQLGTAVTLLRAQVAAQAHALGTDDTTWQGFAADVPRFAGAARRLLIEGQRTNAIRNPRCEGGANGTPGTRPTNWTGFAVISTSALTVERVGTGRESGIDYIRYRISGTSSNGAAAFWTFEAPGSGLASVLGQTTAASVFLRSVAGTQSSFALQLSTRECQGSTQGSNSAISVFPTASWQRFSHIRTNVDAVTDNVVCGLRLSLASGLSVDWTFDIGWPQIGLATFASSPILPAVGTPAASTRGADLVSATLASLGIGANGACTILGTAIIPQNAPVGVNQMIVQVDDGTDNNRYRLHNAAGGATIVAGLAIAGTLVDAASAGSMTAGVLFRWGVAIDGAGRIASCVNGGTVQAATGGPTSGKITLRIGNNASSSSPMFGEVGGLRLLPFPLPDAALQAAVSAMM